MDGCPTEGVRRSFKDAGFDSTSPAIHLHYAVPGVPRRCYRGTVIRNVVLVKLKPGQDPAEVADIQDDFRRLNCPGTLSYTIGSDLGLREGNWSFAIVADFANADAYRAYDLDSAHNRARARLAPLVEQIARAQFEVPRDPFL